MWPSLLSCVSRPYGMACRDPCLGRVAAYLSSVAELKVHLSNAPRSCEQRDLAQMTGWRWPIETTFEEAKGEVGMDQYETRSWPGWHHHMAQSFMAHLFLMRLRLRLKKSAGLDNRPGAPVGRVRITGRQPALSQYHCHH